VPSPNPRELKRGAAGVILLAPDEKSVLLVWEYGAWKPPSGAVDLKESKLRAAVREIHEEVGLVVDESFPPLYLGGWQQSQARDQLINDNFTFFAVKALPGEVVVDGVEIQEAKWFSIDEILRICEREVGLSCKPSRVVPLELFLSRVGCSGQGSDGKYRTD